MHDTSMKCLNIQTQGSRQETEQGPIGKSQPQEPLDKCRSGYKQEGIIPEESITGAKDWLKHKMSTFSTRSLILEHHEMSTEIYQHIFQWFLNLNSLVHNLFFELCTGMIFIQKLFTVMV